MAKRKLIIDCDPGVDDAVMLALAFGSPELDILGITTVGGNVPLDSTTRNARICRQVAGREDVPVFAGNARPLVREAVQASEFHGVSGLGSYKVFEPKKPAEKQHGVDFIVDTLMSAGREGVSLLVTGPFTNIAAALRKRPECARGIAQIAAMGGARSAGGNITASAEYNIFADPQAAEIMLACGRPILLVGLDATHQVRATRKRQLQLKANGSPMALLALEMLEFSTKVERKIVGWNAPPLHDPVPLAWLIKPELLETKPATVRIETKGDVAMGHTQVEFRKGYKGAYNAEWAMKVDAQGVFDLIAERAGRKVKS
jgi:purine nucleosidase